jgi:hypothetical protein
MCRLSGNFGSLKLLEPNGPVQASKCIAVPSIYFILNFEVMYFNAWVWSTQSDHVAYTAATNVIYYVFMTGWPRIISNLMHKILIYLHTIHLLKSSTSFEHYPAHLQEVYVIIVYMQPLVSSLSAGDCPVHQLRKNCQFFLNRCREWRYQKVHIYNYDVDLLKMSKVMLETWRILINVSYANK